MKITRRDVMIGSAAASVAALSSRARAQQAKEIVVGALFPMSGSMAQTGVDARHALDTAVDVINNSYDLNLPLAKERGLPGFGGATIRLIYGDHQGDPQNGRVEAERLITQANVAAVIGCYHSAVTAVVSQTTERYGMPFMCADSSSPTLHRRGLKLFFRASPHDEMFSRAMFDLMDIIRKKGQKIETLALFHEDTIYGTDSANVQLKLATERGYRVIRDIKYRANSSNLNSEVVQLKSANADVLMPSSYTTDSILLIKTMNELGYKPKAIIAQAAGFAEQPFYEAVGALVEGAITRASFSLDIAQNRPSVAKVNEMFKKRAGRDLNDNTSREFTAMLILGDALNRAGSTDPEKIRAALAATEIPGDQTIMPWKRVKFDESGQNNDCDPVLLQYTKGKFVTVFPPQVAVSEPIWPMNA